VTDYARERARMVERQLRRRGVSDERVLGAMERVPREEFVPERIRKRAYDDGALPIGSDQTISQPWVVATITAALGLDGSEKVLEVGTGSGYSTAVLALLARQVITIERHAELASEARARLRGLGSGNVEVRIGDGTRGAPADAPFDAIAVHAAGPAPPPSLVAQLADGGRLVIPVSEPGADMLTVFVRHGETTEARAIAPCRFVPLVGDEGFGEG
jgi:protein-L-isoaspartate(D-aspartate) O-methyltransferase